MAVLLLPCISNLRLKMFGKLQQCQKDTAVQHCFADWMWQWQSLLLLQALSLSSLAVQHKAKDMVMQHCKATYSSFLGESIFG